MSDLRSGVKSQNRKCCTFRGFWSSVLSKILQVEGTTVIVMGNCEATPRDNVLLKISNVMPIQDGWPTDPIAAKIITSRCGLTISWLFSVISLQQFLRWKFRYLLTCLLYLTYFEMVRQSFLVCFRKFFLTKCNGQRLSVFLWLTLFNFKL